MNHEIFSSGIRSEQTVDSRMTRSRSRTPPLTGHFRVQKRRPLVPTRNWFSRERIRREREIFTKFPWVVFLDDRPSPLPPRSPPVIPLAQRARHDPVPHRIPLLPPSIPRLSDLFAPLKKPLLSAGPAPRQTRGWRLTASTGGPAASATTDTLAPSARVSDTSARGRGVRSGAREGSPPPLRVHPRPRPRFPGRPRPLRQPPRGQPRPQPREQPRTSPAQDP